jgi:serine/threonine-protein kinase
MPEAAEYEQFGSYRLTHLLGKGGMASVYRALRSGPMGFSKEVAIKRLHDALANDEKILKALINEARLGGQLKHPNIVEVYEFNKVEETYFLAMEFVDGWTIDRILSFAKKYEAPLPTEVVLEVFAQVCDGLHYAHTLESLEGQDVKLVHRDLKPANIMVSRLGVSKIMDFGIAKAATNLFQTTIVAPEDKTTKGTPHYMSPEQVAGDPDISFHSDIFSLGSVIYECLMGEVLFGGDNLATVLFAVVKADVSSKLDEVDARVPGLGGILAKCLAKKASARWATAAEFGRALQTLRDTLPGTDNIQDYLYLLRGHLVGSQKRRQEKSTLVVELPEFATLFGQLNDSSEPISDARAGMDEAIEAAERSIREGIGASPMVDTSAPTRRGLVAYETGTVQATAPLSSGEAHPDIVETRVGPVPKQKKKKKRGRAADVGAVSAKTRVHPPGESPAEKRAAAAKKRRLWMLAAILLIGTGVAAGAAVFIARTSPNPTLTVAPQGEDDFATVASPTPIPNLGTTTRTDTRAPKKPDSVAALTSDASPALVEATPASVVSPTPAPVAAPTPAPVAAPTPALVAVVEPAVPVKPGKLSIKVSKPWARVLMDGKDIGQKTPMIKYRLAPGTHELELIGSQNAGRVTRTFTIASGEPLVLGSYDFVTSSWSD